MINPNTQEKFNNLKQLAQFDSPIPGQSLTNDPDSPLPFERPPVHAELAPAIDALIVRLCDPEMFHPLINGLRGGISVGEMSEQILYTGYRQGQWNMDLMFLLVEPLMYILIALADIVGFEPLIDDDDSSFSEDEVSNLDKIIDMAKEKIVPSRIPIDIKSKVEELAKDIEPSPQSLLSKEEV